MKQFLLSLALITTSGLASGFPLVLQDLRIENLGNVAYRSAIAADFSGDGVDDLAVFSHPGISGLGMLSVIGGKDGQWSVLQLSAIQDQNLLYRSKRLLLWERAGGNALIAISQSKAPVFPPSDPACLVLEGWPLREVRRFPLTQAVSGAAVGDVDADGRMEIVYTFENGVTRAIDADDGRERWTIDHGGRDVALIQLDADPALEVVISGSNGAVYDGASLDFESPVPESFGPHLTVGRFGDGGSPQLVAGVGQRTSAFAGIPLAPIWELSWGGYYFHAAGDLDSNGRDELLMAYYNGVASVRVLAVDTASRQVSQIASLEGYGVTALGSADLTGDGVAEAYLGTGRIDLPLRIFDPASGTPVYEGPAGPLIFSAAVGDSDADGEADLLVGSYSTRLLDYRTGELKWTYTGTHYDDPGPDPVFTRFIRMVQLDSDDAMEIILAGYNVNGMIVQVLDGATGESQLEIKEYAVGSPRRFVNAIALSDHDGDGTPELFLVSYSDSGAALGPLLSVYSLVNGNLLWQSEELAAPQTVALGATVLSTGDDNSQTLVVVALHRALRAFNVATLEEEWSLTWPEDISATATAVHPELGEEIVVAGASGRVVHLDPSDRSERISYVLPPPVIGITGLVGRSELAFHAGNMLQLIDENGQVLDSSDPLGPSYVTSDLVSVHTAGSKFALMAASRAAIATFEFDPDAIFIDSFSQ